MDLKPCWQTLALLQVAQTPSSLFPDYQQLQADIKISSGEIYFWSGWKWTCWEGLMTDFHSRRNERDVILLHFSLKFKFVLLEAISLYKRANGDCLLQGELIKSKEKGVEGPTLSVFSPSGSSSANRQWRQQSFVFPLWGCQVVWKTTTHPPPLLQNPFVYQKNRLRLQNDESLSDRRECWVSRENIVKDPPRTVKEGNSMWR